MAVTLHREHSATCLPLLPSKCWASGGNTWWLHWGLSPQSLIVNRNSSFVFFVFNIIIVVVTYAAHPSSLLLLQLLLLQLLLLQLLLLQLLLLMLLVLLMLVLVLLLPLRVRPCRLTMMMPLGANVRFWACNMSTDGLEGAIFGMEQRRVCGDTHRKFQSLSSWKSLWKRGKIVHFGVAPSRGCCTSSILASKWQSHSSSRCCCLWSTVWVTNSTRRSHLKSCQCSVGSPFNPTAMTCGQHCITYCAY